jgi:hypothetical protein
MKRARWMPYSMLLPGTLGMLSGLALDARGAGLELLTSQCGVLATRGFFAISYLHWSDLPAMHIGMVCAGLGAAPLRRLTKARVHSSLRVELLGRGLCLAWMLVGMTFGSMLCEWSAIEFIAAPLSDWSAVVVTGGMFAGMIGGMVAHTALNRAICAFSAFSAFKPLRSASILCRLICYG